MAWWIVWLISGPIGWLTVVDLGSRTAQAQSGPVTTQITDKVYRADGTPAQGVLLISWGGFTTASGAPVAAGNTSVTLGADGALSVNLVANAGASPTNSYYTVVYQLNDSTVRTEYWLVTTKSPAALADVRATPGTGNPSQMISKQYVDNAVAGKASDQSVVHLSGLETIAGTKQFATPPSVPGPVNSTDAANKAYVDQAVAAVGAGSYVAKTGDTMSGPLGLPADPISSNQAATKHYVDIGTAGKASLIGGLVPPSQLGNGTANSTMCLKGDSSWGACGTSANAVSIQSVAVDPTQPSDGQVLTYDGISSTYKPKTGGSGNATALQGTPLDVTAPIDGQVVTYDAASGKYTPKSGGGALSAAMQSVRYAADFAWTRTASADLSSAGAKTISLSSCPQGVKGAEKYYYVYVSGTGTAEAVLVTGGTCAGDGNAGTLQFTTLNAHAAGYTIGSATGGIQEASIAARQTTVAANNYDYKQGGRVHVTGQVQLYAPVTFLTTNQVIDFSGSSVVCNFDDDCLVVGNKTDYNSVLSVSLLSPRGEPTIIHGTHAFISVYGQKTRITNLMGLYGKHDSVSGLDGVFGSYIQVRGDQAFLLDGLDTSTGYGLECNATQCGTYVVAPGPFGAPAYMAAVGWLKNLNLNIQCTGNGIDWQSGNTLKVSDSVIQGYSQFGVRGGTARGGYGMIQMDNVYEEDAGSCPNPTGNIGAVGVLVQGGKVDIRGGEGPSGHFPQFANTGATHYDYYIVATNSSWGSSNPLYAGYALTNGSGNITVTTPDIPNAVTFDLLRATGPTGSAVWNAQAPNGTGNFAVVTGVARATACANGVCTFTDSNAAPTSYTVPTPNYSPFVSYWPGSIALFPNGDGGAGLGAVAVLALNAGWAGPQANVNGWGKPSLYSEQCNALSGSPIWQVCLGADTPSPYTGLQNAIVMSSQGDANFTNLKGRLNLGVRSGAGPNHIITLLDSNWIKTLSTLRNRPSNDPGDSYIGQDTVTGNAFGMSLGAPGSISQYIGNAGDGTNWKERLTAAAKTFNVPVTINGNLTVTGTCTGCGGGGAGFSWRGAWSGTTAYNANDAVSQNGSSYIALQANTNQQPPNATYWGVLSQAGGTGAQGPAGQGVPAGGAANQVLAKVDGTNYNTQWVNAPSAESDAFTPTSGTKTINGNLSVSGTIASTGSGPWNMVGSFGALAPAPTGKSMIGFDATGQLAVSENGGAVTEVAKDPAVVHLANAETIAGAKTFAAPVTVNSGSAFLVEGTRQGATSVTLDAGYDFGLYLRSDNVLGCQLSAGYGGGSCFPTALVTSVAGRTGAVTLGEPDVANLTADLAAKAAVTTTVNGHALSSNVTISASDLTTGVLPHAQLPALVSGDIPNNSANTTGTAANLSGTPALPNGTTATTQPAGDNSQKLATTGWVNARTASVPWITYPRGGGSANADASGNKVKLWGVILPYSTTVSSLLYNVQTSDNSASTYDLGIYDSTGNLVIHTGPIAGSTSMYPTGGHSAALIGNGSNGSGPWTLQPGKYYLAITTTSTTTAGGVAGDSGLGVTFCAAQSVTVATGGIFPTTISLPSDVYANNSLTPAWILK